MRRFPLAAATLAMFWTSLAMAGDGSQVPTGYLALSAALVMGLGALGVATAQGKAASAALDGIARNPSAKDDIFVPLVLSLVFVEFQALLSFVIAFLLKSSF